MIRRFSPAACVLALLAAALTACSNSQSAGLNGAAANEGAAAPVDGNRYDPCTKLSLDMVQPLFSAPITMRPEIDVTGTAAGCIFATAGNKSQLQVLTVKGPQAADFYNDPENQKGAVALAGIGDRAIREARDISVYALKGDVYCQVHTDSTARSQMRGLERFADKDVPDDIANTVARQLGGLCNRIYGI